MQIGPLPVVDELFECLLKVVEDTGISSLNLVVVDDNLGQQLLSLGG